MVGDLWVDIEAAIKAGLAGAIGITHGFGTAKSLKDAGANYVIDSFDELVKVINEIFV